MSVLRDFGLALSRDPFDLTDVMRRHVWDRGEYTPVEAALAVVGWMRRGLCRESAPGLYTWTLARAEADLRDKAAAGEDGDEHG
jgi:hypothetical protein